MVNEMEQLLGLTFCVFHVKDLTYSNVGIFNRSLLFETLSLSFPSRMQTAIKMGNFAAKERLAPCSQAKEILGRKDTKKFKLNQSTVGDDEKGSK